MTNKSTRRTLLTSVLSLFLCFTMLVGTTFAWFTDSATSGGNVITAGTLKINVQYTLDGATWNDLADADDLFQKGLWEPGHTEMVALRIENAGDLALKYIANLNVISETAGKTANGDDIILSEILTVSTLVAEDAAEVAAAFASEDGVDYDATALLKDAGTLRGETAMYEGDVHYLVIKVDMAESVGNEANSDGVNVPSIDFDIAVLATQSSYENDSFGNQYDADLEVSKNGVAQTLTDGSEVFYYNEESGYNGRVRLTSLPENVGNEYVVPEEVNDLGGALVGANLDKLTIHAGVEYAYKSLEGANIDTVVLAEGATVVPNRTFYKANIDTIVIPETVTAIQENAFAMAGVENLVIPASVATVGEAAFQHMPNLTTVTFEGNTAIEGYAFRGCAALRTVYLKGDDVSFVVSQSGKNSCWFCNGESNNPNTSNITFYVENEIVAARLRTALGAEKPETTPIYVNGVIYG